MENVADLLALASEPGVTQGAAEVMARDPKRDDALIDFAHLPRTGDDATAVDQGAHAVAEDVLLDQLLAGKFAGAVERAWPVEWEALGDPTFRESGDARCVVPAEPRLGLDEWQVVQGGDRIDAAGAEEQQGGAAGSGRLQTVDRAEEVRVEDGSRRAALAGVDRGLGGAVDQKVEWREVVEVVGRADIAMAEIDRCISQARQAQLAAATLEAVQDGHTQFGRASRKRSARFEPTKPAPPVMRRFLKCIRQSCLC